MKKVFVLLVVLATAVTANAQFEKGKAYLGASLSGFDISSQAKKFHFGVNVKAGYLFMDNLMATAQVGYDHLDSIVRMVSATSVQVCKWAMLSLSLVR